MIVTTSEAAGILGVTESGVRMLVLRGDLEPISRGARPLTFWTETVVELEYRRRPKAQKRRVQELAEQWACASAVDL